MTWLVRAPRLPDVVMPVGSEAEARELVAKMRQVCHSHRAQVAWEYGTHDPAIPRSYRRIGPGPAPADK